MDGVTVPLQNSLGKELVLVERVRSKFVLVVQQKTQIGQIVSLAVWIYPAEIWGAVNHNTQVDRSLKFQHQESETDIRPKRVKSGGILGGNGAIPEVERGG